MMQAWKRRAANAGLAWVGVATAAAVAGMLVGCSGETTAPTDSAPAPAAEEAPAADDSAAAVTPAPVSTPTYDRYAPGAEKKPAPASDLSFDLSDDSLRAASADSTLVGDRYSR